MKDKSKLEISTQDIQEFYNGKSVNFADIESFVSGQVVNNNNGQSSKASQPGMIVNNQGFYVSQSEYIEYQIAKREVIKKALRRKKFGDNLWLAFLWLLRTIFSIILTCVICWGFYMLCWALQKTF